MCITFGSISNAVQHKNTLFRMKFLVMEKEYETYSKVLMNLIALLHSKCPEE